MSLTIIDPELDHERQVVEEFLAHRPSCKNLFKMLWSAAGSLVSAEHIRQTISPHSEDGFIDKLAGALRDELASFQETRFGQSRFGFQLEAHHQGEGYRLVILGYEKPNLK